MTAGDQEHQGDELTPLEQRLLDNNDTRGGYVPRDGAPEPDHMPAEPASASPTTGVRAEDGWTPEPPPPQLED